jgi:hypothetical protein
LTDSRNVPADRGSKGPLRIWRPRRRWTHQALDGRPDQPPSGSVLLEREQVGRATGIQIMTIGGATEDELARIRGACGKLGADEEMTDLVLASHRHDRGLLDVMLREGSDLRDYVRHKLAIWEAIFNAHLSEEEITNENRSTKTANPASSQPEHGMPR